MEFFSVGFWQTVVGLTIPAVIAILGYIFAYRLNMRFERRKKRNDLRIQYLINAYRKLESACNRRQMTLQ